MKVFLVYLYYRVYGLKFVSKDSFQFRVYANKQNCRIWGSENPKMIIENPLYPQRVTVQYGFWTGGIIGPYFFENEWNGLRYRTMINEFLWPELEMTFKKNTRFSYKSK